MAKMKRHKIIEDNWYYFAYKINDPNYLGNNNGTGTAYKKRIKRINGDGTFVTIIGSANNPHLMLINPEEEKYTWRPCTENAPPWIKVKEGWDDD